MRAALVNAALPGAAVELEDETGGPLGSSLTAGLTRIVQPREQREEATDQDEFTVLAINGDQLRLRRAVSVPGLPDELSPVKMPAGAAERLQPGDILNLELTRGAAAWEVLDALVVVPGGYAENR